VKRLVPSHHVPLPRVGDVWLDLSTRGRLLTIQGFIDKGDVKYAICTSYNPHRPIGRQLKTTRIRCDRFTYYTLPLRQRGELKLITVGFVYMQIRDVDIRPPS